MGKKVLVLYTGGTIGMTRTDDGYRPQPGGIRQLLAEVPDLTMKGMPDYDLMEFDRLIDSSDVTVAEWNRIAQTVCDHYDSYDGFVILHGTDTMAYTASALSFQLEGLNKPVILTGSQIPLCELRSDANDNLVTSMLFAASDQIHEVCLYFGGKLLRGNRAVKVSSDGLTAFSSPNLPPLAEARIRLNYRENELLPSREGPLKMTRLSEIPIAVLKIFPGIQYRLFEPIVTEGLSGLVLEAFGAGNIPGYENALLPLVRKAAEHDAVIVVCSQCLKGEVSLGTYATSMGLKRAGAVSGYDMTTEAAVTKLTYLFSLGLSREEIRLRMESNLRGELSVFSEKNC